MKLISSATADCWQVGTFGHIQSVSNFYPWGWLHGPSRLIYHICDIWKTSVFSLKRSDARKLFKLNTSCYIVLYKTALLVCWPAAGNYFLERVTSKSRSPTRVACVHEATTHAWPTMTRTELARPAHTGLRMASTPSSRRKWGTADSYSPVIPSQIRRLVYQPGEENARIAWGDKQTRMIVMPSSSESRQWMGEGRHGTVLCLYEGEVTRPELHVC